MHLVSRQHHSRGLTVTAFATVLTARAIVTQLSRHAHFVRKPEHDRLSGRITSCP